MANTATASADFWDDFAFQHATFSSVSSPDTKHAYGKKKFGPAVLGPRHGSPDGPYRPVPASRANMGGGVRGAVGRGAGLAAAAGAIAYNVSLSLNRWAITYNAKADTATFLGRNIRRICPAPGRGGVLVGYEVWVAKRGNSMGDRTARYGHGSVKIVGAGPNSLAVLRQSMNRVPANSISAAKPGAAQRALKIELAPEELKFAYLWIVRS